jgi:hypothetical protein
VQDVTPNPHTQDKRGSSPPRYQPGRRNITFPCHPLDSVAFVARFDGAEPDGFVCDPEDIEGRQQRRFGLLHHAGSIGWDLRRFNIGSPLRRSPAQRKSPGLLPDPGRDVVRRPGPRAGCGAKPSRGQPTRAGVGMFLMEFC